MRTAHFFHYGPCELFPEGTQRGSTGGERGRRPPKVSERNKEKYREAFESGWSVESRLKDMERYGWDKMVCIPGTGAGQNTSSF